MICVVRVSCWSLLRERERQPERLRSFRWLLLDQAASWLMGHGDDAYQQHNPPVAEQSLHDAREKRRSFLIRGDYRLSGQTVEVIERASSLPLGGSTARAVHGRLQCRLRNHRWKQKPNCYRRPRQDDPTLNQNTLFWIQSTKALV